MVVRTLCRLARLVPQLAGDAYEASTQLELLVTRVLRDL